jgi:hypothetical protein
MNKDRETGAVEKSAVYKTDERMYKKYGAANNNMNPVYKAIFLIIF